jgi:glyoxylase-like metal-dependent hydrolase (beta-lactamase superfamily II)
VLPGVHRLTAPNPSVMTGRGTNTYLIGRSRLIVIDPGPDDPRHLEATAATAWDLGRVVAIAVTHTHADHAPAAAGLAALTGAPVLGYGSRDGFVADRELRDGDVLEEADLSVRVLHTPGHASDHLCFLLRTGGEEVLLSGDHIMGGSTVVIAPPDGDMSAYMASLARLLELEPSLSVIAPGHGPLLPDPEGVIKGYMSHRREREAAVLSALGEGSASVDDVVAAVYTDVPIELHPIARYSVWAHLLKLRSEGRADSTAPEDLEASWRALQAQD